MNHYSGDHHLCGYKTEFSVLLIGLAIRISTAYSSSVSDIEISRKNREWHDKYSRKNLDENNDDCEGELNP